MFSGMAGIEREEEEEAVAYSFFHALLFFHVQKHAFVRLIFFLVVNCLPQSHFSKMLSTHKYDAIHF